MPVFVIIMLENAWIFVLIIFAYYLNYLLSYIPYIYPTFTIIRWQYPLTLVFFILFFTSLHVLLSFIWLRLSRLVFAGSCFRPKAGRRYCVICYQWSGVRTPPRAIVLCIFNIECAVSLSLCPSISVYLSVACVKRV